MRPQSRWIGVAAISVMLSCAGCGSDGQQTTQPVVVAPTPSPTPTAAPTPTPSPSPSPSPTPTGVPSIVGPVAGANAGESFTGPMACATGTFLRSSSGASSGRLTDIQSLGTTKIDNRLTVQYVATDMFRLDVNGFGGAAFGPMDKANGPTMAYHYFQKSSDELEIYHNLSGFGLFFTTIGRYSSDGSLCFFAASGEGAYVDPGSRFQGAFPFSGFADGVARIGTSHVRFTESAAQAGVNYVAHTISITLTLRGKTPLFGELSGTTPLTDEIVTGTATISASGAVAGALTGPNGLTGSLQGQLFASSPTGLVITFDLRRPNGDIYVGAAALDASL